MSLQSRYDSGSLDIVLCLANAYHLSISPDDWKSSIDDVILILGGNVEAVEVVEPVEAIEVEAIEAVDDSQTRIIEDLRRQPHGAHVKLRKSQNGLRQLEEQTRASFYCLCRS